MHRSLIALAALASLSALAGCAGTFGHTAYSIKANAAGGYDLDARDGKEFAGRAIEFDAKRGLLVVNEGASKAFKGQGIGATLNPLPTLGLDKILAP
jgi:hypothetical protein